MAANPPTLLEGLLQPAQQQRIERHLSKHIARPILFAFASDENEFPEHETILTAPAHSAMGKRIRPASDSPACQLHFAGTYSGQCHDPTSPCESNPISAR